MLQRQNTAEQRRRDVAIVERRQHDSLHLGVPAELTEATVLRQHTGTSVLPVASHQGGRHIGATRGESITHRHIGATRGESVALSPACRRPSGTDRSDRATRTHRHIGATRGESAG